MNFIMKTHGKGSIVKLESNKSNARCRKWQLRVSVGKNPYTGKYVSKTRRFTGTYTEAVNELERFKSELSKSEYTNSKREKISFSAYAETYCKLRAEGKTGINSTSISPGTVKKDKWNFNAVSREIGGDTQIGRITPRMLEQMFINMRTGNGATRKKLSGTYTQTIYMALNGLFNFAVKNGDLPRNPLDTVEVPKNDTKPKRALGKHDLETFVNSLNAEDRMEFGVKMIVCCGLRRSEAAYSLIDGINYKEEYIEVRKSKTKAGLRIIPLTPDGIDAIKTRMSVLIPKMNELGVEVTKDTPLLSDELGKGVTPHYIGVWWQKNREKFNLKGWTLHELRHSFISLLDNAGASLSAMQDIAGHESPETTVGIYSHANLEDKRVAMNKAYEYLHDKNSRTGTN